MVGFGVDPGEMCPANPLSEALRIRTNVPSTYAKEDAPRFKPAAAMNPVGAWDKRYGNIPYY